DVLDTRRRASKGEFRTVPPRPGAPGLRKHLLRIEMLPGLDVRFAGLDAGGQAADIFGRCHLACADCTGSIQRGQPLIIQRHQISALPSCARNCSNCGLRLYQSFERRIRGLASLLSLRNKSRTGSRCYLERGRSSGVEHNLAKVRVGRSNRLARSNYIKGLQPQKSPDLSPKVFHACMVSAWAAILSAFRAVAVGLYYISNITAKILSPA